MDEKGYKLKIIKEITEKKFFKDFSIVLLLNTISKALNFFASTRAAKILGPENIGLSSVVQTTSTQISLFTDGGFNTIGVKILLDDEKLINRNIQKIISLRILIGIIILILITPFIFQYKFSSIALITGIILFVNSVIDLNFVYRALQIYSIYSIISSIGSILSFIFIFLLVNGHSHAVIELFILSISIFTSHVISWVVYFNKKKSVPFKLFSIKEYLGLINNTKFYWINSIVATVYPAIQIYIIMMYLGLTWNGIFRVANSLTIPVEFIMQTVGILLLPKVVAWNKLEIDLFRKKIHDTFLLQFLIILPVVLGLIFFSNIIFHFLLGNRFQSGVNIFRIILIGKFINSTGQVFSFALVSLNKHKFYFLSVLSIAIINITISIPLIKYWGIFGAAIALMTTDILYPIINYILLNKSYEKTNPSIY
jgi:PST family polysaccharide transporter